MLTFAKFLDSIKNATSISGYNYFDLEWRLTKYACIGCNNKVCRKCLECESCLFSKRGECDRIRACESCIRCGCPNCRKYPNGLENNDDWYDYIEFKKYVNKYEDRLTLLSRKLAIALCHSSVSIKAWILLLSKKFITKYLCYNSYKELWDDYISYLNMHMPCTNGIKYSEISGLDKEFFDPTNRSYQFKSNDLPDIIKQYCIRTYKQSQQSQQSQTTHPILPGIYPTSYNILRIMAGMGGLFYS